MSDLEPLSVNPRLVSALRIASVIFLLASIAVVIFPYWIFWAVISIILNLLVLLGLHTIPPKRFALVLAVALGSSWFVLLAIHTCLVSASFFQPLMAHHSSWDVLSFLAAATWILTLLQGGMIGVAWKLCRSGASGRCGRLRLLIAVVGGAFFGALMMAIFGITSIVPSGLNPVVGSLRTMNSAEATYAVTYRGSYSTTLAELGVPPEGTPPSASAAGLIDAGLAAGLQRSRKYDVVDELVDRIESLMGREIKHGYRYEYRPGPRDDHGRIQSYTICARPINRALDRASFFTDQSAVVRVTFEDRCPIPEDDPIGGRVIL